VEFLLSPHTPSPKGKSCIVRSVDEDEVEIQSYRA
jgi:hypothetical protein